MRKSLLTLVALVATTVCFAQGKVAGERVVSRKVTGTQQLAAPVRQQLSMDFQASQSSRRAYADEVFYARPEGTYWLSGKTTSGQNWKYLVVPPFTDLKFINVSTDKTAGSWKLGTTALNKYVDADNNLTFSFDKVSYGYVSYCPVLTTIDATSENSAGVEYKIADYVDVLDSVPSVLYPFNYSDCPRYYGYSDGASAFMSGADSFDFDGDGTTETFYPQFRQYFEKPASPLSLSEVYLWASSTDPNFTGSTLKLVFNKVERIVKNNRTYKVPGEKIGEMTCAEAEMDESVITGTSVYPGTLYFANMGEDDFGTPYSIPLLLDDEFVITIEGTEDPKIDVRFYFCDQGDYLEEWYTRATPTYIVPFDAEGNSMIREDGNPNGLSYYNKSSQGEYCYCIAFHFYGEMDGVAVETSSELNKQIAPVGGGDTASKPGEGETTGAPAYVWTNYPFFDEEGNDTEQYDFEGLPEWASVKIDPTYYEYGRGTDNEVRGLHMIWFEVQPLPEGETGRTATVYVTSAFGVKSVEPIYILQGDVQDPSGIKAIRFDAQGKFVGSTYNMAGQPVDANFKGLVIKDGKKMIVK